jgi:hypothetical protein
MRGAADRLRHRDHHFHPPRARPAAGGPSIFAHFHAFVPHARTLLHRAPCAARAEWRSELTWALPRSLRPPFTNMCSVIFPAWALGPTLGPTHKRFLCPCFDGA